MDAEKNISDVPVDIFVDLFTYLDVKSILKSILVCKKWFSVWSMNYFWGQLLSIHYQYDDRSSSDPQVNFDTFKTLYTGFTFEYYRRRKELRDLDESSFNSMSGDSFLRNGDVVSIPQKLISGPPHLHKQIHFVYHHPSIYYFAKCKESEKSKYHLLRYNFGSSGRGNEKYLFSVNFGDVYNETSDGLLDAVKDEDCSKLLYCGIMYDQGESPKLREFMMKLDPEVTLFHVNLGNTRGHNQGNNRTALPKGLKYLVIGGETGIMSQLNGFVDLLYLSINHVDSFRCSLISKLRNLKFLQFVRCGQMMNLHELKELVNLRVLRFEGFGTVEVYGDRTKSENMSLRFCEKMVNLKMIFFEHYPVKDISPLYSLPNLRRIHGTDTNISSLPEKFDKNIFRSLEVLDILSTPVSPHQVETFESLYPNVQVHYDWKKTLLFSLQKATKLIFRSGDECPSRYYSSGENNRKAVEEFLKLIELIQSNGHCMCYGNPHFDFYDSSGRRLVYLEFHHFYKMRCQQWPHDSLLSRGSQEKIMEWISKNVDEKVWKEKFWKKMREEQVYAFRDYKYFEKIDKPLRTNDDVADLFTLYGSNESMNYLNIDYSRYKFSKTGAIGNQFKDIENCLNEISGIEDIVIEFLENLDKMGKRYDSRQLGHFKFGVVAYVCDRKNELIASGKMKKKALVNLIFCSLDGRFCKVARVLKLFEMNAVKEFILKEVKTSILKSFVYYTDVLVHENVSVAFLKIVGQLPMSKFKKLVSTLMKSLIAKEYCLVKMEDISRKEYISLLLGIFNVQKSVGAIQKLFDEEQEKFKEQLKSFKDLSAERSEQKSFQDELDEYRKRNYCDDLQLEIQEYHSEEVQKYRTSEDSYLKRVRFDNGILTLALAYLGKTELLSIQHFNSEKYYKELIAKHQKLIPMENFLVWSDNEYKWSIELVERFHGTVGMQYICEMEITESLAEPLRKLCRTMVSVDVPGKDLMEKFLNEKELDMKVLKKWYFEYGKRWESERIIKTSNKSEKCILQ